MEAEALQEVTPEQERLLAESVRVHQEAARHVIEEGEIWSHRFWGDMIVAEVEALGHKAHIDNYDADLGWHVVLDGSLGAQAR